MKVPPHSSAFGAPPQRCVDTLLSAKGLELRCALLREEFSSLFDACARQAISLAEYQFYLRCSAERLHEPELRAELLILDTRQRTAWSTPLRALSLRSSLEPFLLPALFLFLVAFITLSFHSSFVAAPPLTEASLFEGTSDVERALHVAGSRSEAEESFLNADETPVSQDEGNG